MGALEDRLLQSIGTRFPGTEQHLQNIRLDNELNRAYLAKSLAINLPELLRQRLALRYQGSAPELNVLDDIQMTINIENLLGEASVAVGNLTLPVVSETVADVAGTSTALGYTVPIGRRSKILHISAMAESVVNDEGQWLQAQLLLVPSGAGDVPLDSDIIQPRNNFGEGPSVLRLGPEELLLDPGDRVGAELVQRSGDPAASAYNGRFLFMAVEVDVGFGFRGF